MFFDGIGRKMRNYGICYRTRAYDTEQETLNNEFRVSSPKTVPGFEKKKSTLYGEHYKLK